MSDEYGLLIDHVDLRVSDLAASRAFYVAAVGALGLGITWEDDHSVEIRELGLFDDQPASGPVHIAFRAGAREAVERFYAAALGAGGRDNGAPGERGKYHSGYFSAYVLDPDGNNVEAVYHGKAGVPAIPSDLPERPLSDETADFANPSQVRSNRAGPYQLRVPSKLTTCTQ